MKNSHKKARTILPGFGLSLGYTVSYLSLMVIIPLSMLVFDSLGLGFSRFWEVVSTARVAMSYWLSFYTAFCSAFIDMIVGFIVAWVLVRYEFPGRKLFDSLVDLPFALPTAVAGISLTTLFSSTGWLGMWLDKMHITVVNTPAGISIALIFIGFPFVVRTVQPILQELEPELEEMALSLGANRRQIFLRVIFPTVFPAMITGATLAFARSIGEYGSVIFISGNIPLRTEITPLLIMTKLDQFKYEEAAAIALTLLMLSFGLLLMLNVVQRRIYRKYSEA